MPKFFISTALPYVNASPHAGFALEAVQTDVIARYLRASKNEVFFLSGTDENSLKNVRAAEAENISVGNLVDRNAQKFYELKQALNLTYDDFIRTTEERHIKGAQKFWQACKNDIYKSNYSGLYCVDCEEFYKDKDLIDGFCPEHKKPPEKITEENYFFKLSEYQEQLKQLIQKDEIKIIPVSRKNEILSFLEQGLEDICISRPAERSRGWGIDVPNDSSQKMWVWFDALSNYINALGYAENSEKFQEWWQNNENKMHIIGKGIIRFHAVYWPAILLAAGLKLPTTIFVHGYLLSGGQKMAKSLGNVVDPFELVNKYGADATRYFLLREFPSTEDGDFTYEKFERRYNSDLANGLGNLFERILAMIVKYWDNEIKKIPIDSEIQSFIKETEKIYAEKMNTYQFHEALVVIFS